MWYTGHQMTESGLFPGPERFFSPTAPIDEKSLFAGRASQISAVVRAINQKGQHVILFGERGVGKTSLANVLSGFLQSPAHNILTPRVNCDSTDDFESLWRKILAEIEMHRTINRIGFDSNTSLEGFAASDLLGNPVSPDGVRRALTVLSRTSLPILIVDEFDRLDPEPKRGVADTIKALSDHSVPATVILVGVADSVDELIVEHQSVERALVQVRMPRMSREEIEEIINNGFSQLGLGIDPKALRRIHMLAQGLPHYAHLLGLESASLAISTGETRVTRETLDRAISNAIAGSQQSIKQGWHAATTSPRKDNLFSEVLLACALASTDEMGYFAAQDVRQPLRQILHRQVDIPNYAQHLRDFCEPKRGRVLQRTGEKRRYRFRFQSPLMQPFVVMQGFATGKIDDDDAERLLRN